MKNCRALVCPMRFARIDSPANRPSQEKEIEFRGSERTIAESLLPLCWSKLWNVEGFERPVVAHVDLVRRPEHPGALSLPLG
jgi:hypothetical protein